MGLISEKTEVLYTELNERVETATGSYSVTGDSLQYIYCACVEEASEHSIKMFSSQIFPTYIFLKILIMVAEQLH